MLIGTARTISCPASLCHAAAVGRQTCCLSGPASKNNVKCDSKRWTLACTEIETYRSSSPPTLGEDTLRRSRMLVTLRFTSTTSVRVIRPSEIDNRREL